MTASKNPDFKLNPYPKSDKISSFWLSQFLATFNISSEISNPVQKWPYYYIISPLKPLPQPKSNTNYGKSDLSNPINYKHLSAISD